MSSEPDVVVNLSIDTSKFEAAMESARIGVLRVREKLFGLFADDLSRNWPSCEVDHEDWFEWARATYVPALWICPGCGAAL